jgi:hypothetical protein
MSKLKEVHKEKVLFGDEYPIDKIKYTDLLNYMIENVIINKILKFIDKYRIEICFYILKEYSEYSTDEKIKQYKEEIELDKYRYDTETILKKIKVNLSTEDFIKHENEMQKDFTDFIHKAIIDMIFPFPKGK